MNETKDKPLIILASKSPRRKHLLERAGISFSVMPSGFDEAEVDIGPPEEYVKTLAERKAADISSQYPESWVIGADTIVVADDEILGKPGSREEACGMLGKLSGKKHRVLTGFAVLREENNRYYSKSVDTDVVFRDLTAEEINWYVKTKEPFGKAGAYAIQGIGAIFVKSVFGSYTNVVGLPVCEVTEHLIKEGVFSLDCGHAPCLPD